MTWDTAADPAPDGAYTAWGGLFAWSTDPGVDPVGEWRVPSGGVILPLTIDHAVPSATSTWGAVKATYR